VVDAGDVDLLHLPAVPAALPAVVVAVAGRCLPELAGGEPDVALTTAAGPPRPWVSVEDPGAEVAHLVRNVTLHRPAALALVEVLRCGAGLGTGAGLVLESVAYSMLQSGADFARWMAARTPRTSRPVPARPPVALSRNGDVLWVELDRPEVHNAYDRAMRDCLYEAFTLAAADAGLRVELRGRGPSFCSGGDLDEFGSFADPPSAHLVRTGRSPARLIDAVSTRVTARLHGACAGSGIELPAFAGRVVADPGTRIWLPELAMGLIPGAGGTVSLPRRIGRERAAWMALSGRPVTAATALEWGLVDGVEPVGPAPAKQR
jgi:enoyl-CoA hydratase/carnithine racemase